MILFSRKSFYIPAEAFARYDRNHPTIILLCRGFNFRGPLISRLGTTIKSGVLAVVGLLCAGLYNSIRGSETSGACPFSSTATEVGITDDGCAGAEKEPPQFPKMLEGYGKKRPPFDVAGVDYYVGVPTGLTLRDPAAATLPEGCGINAGQMTCTKDNAIISGYDFSLRDGMQLVIPSGVSGTIISHNKFSIGSACKDPLIDARGGAITITHNSFEGSGPLCQNLRFGTLIFGIYSPGVVSTVEYNSFTDIPTDVLQYAGPSTGAASIILRYNLFYIQGFSGHPDGFQANGGNFDPVDISFNTYFNVSPPSKIGAQPLHVEAQLTAALNRSTVSYNTIVTPGHCDGGRGSCVANTDIACKQDGGSNKNTNFSAYGNYIDSSGAIAPLLNGGCSGTSWGIPVPNMDLKTGRTIFSPNRKRGD